MANRRFALINRPASGVTESNDLTSAVTWANVPDANITESSVTQHEAALTILESQITDGAILGRVAADEDITGFWDFQDGLQISDVVTTGTQWQIKAEDTYGQLIIEPEAVGGGGNAWGIGLQGGGYIAYGGGTSTLATPGSPAHGDNLNNYTSFMLGDPNDFDYVADIGFFDDTLFQFGTYPVDGGFGFYVTDGTPGNWIYPFYVETRNQDTWFLSYTVNIGQTTGGAWDYAGSVSTPTKYASLSEDGVDFNFVLTGLTDLSFTGMTAVNVPALASSGAVTGSNLNVANWDTAYGWGDHAGLYGTAAAVALNTAKVTNATHTGEVSGSGALTVNVSAITNKTALTSGLASTDELLLSDGGVIKRMDVSVLRDYMYTYVPTIQDKNTSTVNGKTANYTLALADEGETIRMTGSTAAQTITIPANASIAFPTGTLICIQNDASVSWSLAITTDTLTWAEDNTTGTRTLAAGATAVIQKVASTSWKVAGSSLVT